MEAIEHAMAAQGREVAPERWHGRATNGRVEVEELRPAFGPGLEEGLDLARLDRPGVDVPPLGEGVDGQEREALVLEGRRDGAAEELMQLEKVGGLLRATQPVVEGLQAAAGAQRPGDAGSPRRGP